MPSGEHHKHHKSSRRRSHRSRSRSRSPHRHKHRHHHHHRRRRSRSRSPSSSKHHRRGRREEGGRRVAAFENPPAEDRTIAAIDESDYFLKNPEFCVFLVEAKDVYFGELESPEARRLFKDDFVPAWNARMLSSKYYDGIGSGHTVPRTRPSGRQIEAPRLDPPKAQSNRRARESLIDERENAHLDRRRERERRDKASRDHRDFVEANYPKETGRDALRQKRMGKTAMIRDRENDRGGFDTVEVYDGRGGDGTSDYQKRRQAQDRRREIKRLEMEEKLERHNAAVEEKLDKFRALLQSGPIKIRKRSD